MPLGKALEGWAFQETARIQRGSPFNINGMRLVGIVRIPDQRAYVPQFTRFGLNQTKKPKITERVNVEFCADSLNAFNHVNFLA